MEPVRGTNEEGGRSSFGRRPPDASKQLDEPPPQELDAMGEAERDEAIRQAAQEDPHVFDAISTAKPPARARDRLPSTTGMRKERQAFEHATDDPHATQLEEERRGAPLPPPQPHVGLARRRGEEDRMAHASQGQAVIPPPPPMDDWQASMEARVRVKLQSGEPLDDDERLFLASLPADRQVWPGQFERQ